MSTTVFRYEDEHGIGPYQSSTYVGLEHEDSNHPSPRMEGFRSLETQEFCALTLEQFTNWFTRGECDLLESRGFKIIEYEVPPDALPFKGEKQVVITKALCVEKGVWTHRRLL